MGKRRRKLLRRKYAKLPWNKYYENHPEEQNLSEQKINKVVEDNSVVLERMKNVSSTCDTILQTFNTTEDNEVDTPDEIDVRAPMIKVAQPPPEIKETLEVKYLLST